MDIVKCYIYKFKITLSNPSKIVIHNPVRVLNMYRLTGKTKESICNTYLTINYWFYFEQVVPKCFLNKFCFYFVVRIFEILNTQQLKQFINYKKKKWFQILIFMFLYLPESLKYIIYKLILRALTCLCNLDLSLR